jgi:hypothetical protein
MSTIDKQRITAVRRTRAARLYVRCRTAMSPYESAGSQAHERKCADKTEPSCPSGGKRYAPQSTNDLAYR